MTTYALSAIRHDLPGQIYVTAPLAVLPAGFTLGIRQHEPLPFPGRSSTERPPWKECSHPHEAVCDCKPVALGLGVRGGGRKLASSGHSRSHTSGHAEGSLLLEHWNPGACRVTARHLGLVALLASSACPCTLSLRCAGGGCSSNLM